MPPDIIPESPSGSHTQEDPFHPDILSTDLAVLTHRVDILAEGFHKLINGPTGLTTITAVLTELQDKFSALEDRPSAAQGTSTHPQTPNGDPSPLQFRRSHFPWVDNTTL